jgi:hypothetical protein
MRKIMSAGAVAMLMMAVAGPAGQAQASPARYVFEMCDSALPGGGDAGVRYAQNSGQPWQATNRCNEPEGSLSIRQTGPIEPGGAANWALPIEPPPGGTMESIRISMGGCGQSPRVIAYVLYESWPLRCFPELRDFSLRNDFRLFDLKLKCEYQCAAGASIYGRYFATKMSDPVPPRVGELGGSLLDGDVKRGQQSLVATASDVGGGVSSVEALVNGLPAAPARAASCAVAQVANASVYGTVAAEISPCPAGLTTTWNLDTDAYPFRSGANSVQVCASDFATLSDPNTSCSQQKSITVDDTCPESAVPGGEELRADFDGSNQDTTSVGYGHAATVTGRLVDRSGDPVSGATLCVKMGTLGVDPRPRAVGAVQTDHDGGFAYQVPPGPNREVVIGYRHEANQLARSVRYYAHTKPTLRAKPGELRNGGFVHLSGVLPGPRPGGRVVVVQANPPRSKRWITFRRATTGSGGGFRASYRFTSTTRPTRYRFRAVVPAQSGYPWLEGHSKAVAVLVRG